MKRTRPALAGVLLLTLWSGVASAGGPLPSKARLIERGDFAGFTPASRATVYTSAKAWVALDPRPAPPFAAGQTARLKREGFKRVVMEFLFHGKRPQEGVSWAMQLGSAAAARAELGAVLRDERALDGGTFSTFAGSGVPGARGYRELGNNGSGENLLFADGPYLYLVGQGWGPTEKVPSHAALLAAVRKLYGRVHGR